MHPQVATRDEGTQIDPKWLVAAMAERDVSSAALARRLEVDDTTIYRWRKGDSPITRLAWLGVLHALDLPAAWEPSPSKKPRKS